MFSAALEAYNRASFDPPTPEMQLVPAEEIQRDPIIAGWFAVFGLLAVVAAGWAVIA